MWDRTHTKKERAFIWSIFSLLTYLVLLKVRSFLSTQVVHNMVPRRSNRALESFLCVEGIFLTKIPCCQSRDLQSPFGPGFAFMTLTTSMETNPIPCGWWCLANQHNTWDICHRYMRWTLLSKSWQQVFILYRWQMSHVLCWLSRHHHPQGMGFVSIEVVNVMKAKPGPKGLWRSLDWQHGIFVKNIPSTQRKLSRALLLLRGIMLWSTWIERNDLTFNNTR